MVDPDFWRGRRVMLSGHTGFKGSWLRLWLLSLGADVWGYALAPEPGRALFTDLGLDQATGNADWGISGTSRRCVRSGGFGPMRGGSPT